MAIQKVKVTNPNEYWPKYADVGEPTHVGMVVALTSSEVRIMSDVWATGYTAVVWNPETGSPTYFELGNSEFGNKFRAEVDATPEVLEAYQAYLEEEARKDREARALRHEEEAREAEERARKAPTLGRKVLVTRGNSRSKTPKGTVGYVFWSRDGRVGIATSDRIDPRTGRHLDVAWVNASYCEATKDENEPSEVEARRASWRQAWEDAKNALKSEVRTFARTEEVPF